MAVIVGWLGTALLQREELVAQIDEGRSLALAAKLEVEQANIEGQSLFDVTDLESDMIETDGARFLCFGHKVLHPGGRRFSITPLPRHAPAAVAIEPVGRPAARRWWLLYANSCVFRGEEMLLIDSPSPKHPASPPI